MYDDLHEKILRILKMFFNKLTKLAKIRIVKGEKIGTFSLVEKMFPEKNHIFVKLYYLLLLINSK